MITLDLWITRPSTTVSQQAPTFMATFYVLDIHDWYFNAGIWRQGCILIMDEVIKIVRQSKKHPLPVLSACHFALVPQ